ncbi:PAS domain-containing protein [Variovorax sp. J22P240]|uniref:PAS domain-containing protein n=1 Tax=Variovorax sp. J22P240 TaxID=3053514 RepID=UPI0025788CCB|nr:PAS domain-containing protein [Variovorax sp. J22P240]MDM0000664.1 PAS domain-containing protein [Variovorax sp. J22P240]
MALWLENLSIRSRMILLMVGVMLAVTALLAWVLANDVRRSRNAAYEKVRILATGTAATVQRTLDQFESVLARASARPLVRALDPAHCDPLVAEYVRLTPTILSYALRDARGEIICRYERAPLSPSVVTDAAGSVAAVRIAGFEMGNLVDDARSGLKIMALSYPIRDEAGRQTALLVMTVDLLVLNQLLQASIPENAVVTVIDRTGTVLLRSSDPETFIGARPAAGEPEPADGQREGFLIAKGSDGAPRLTAFLTLSDVDWRVAVSLPEVEVFADYHAAIRRAIGIGLTLCLLALGLAWRLSSAIAQWSSRLRGTAAQMTTGIDIIRAGLPGPPEIRSVPQQLNWMLDARDLSKPRLRRDMSERKLAEQALRASASKLHAALSSMSDAVCIADVDGRLVEFNDAFASFHRFADKSDCGGSLADYPGILEMAISKADPAPLEEWPLSRALRGETGTNVEYRLRRKDTGTEWVGSYSFAPIPSEDGTVAGAIMTARDVTTAREVQLDLESSHFALQQLIASRDQVQEEERKRIARELHDDLQQTLAAIRMDLQVITDRFGAHASGLPALVAGVDRLAERAIVSTRRIVNDLRPPMLEDLGLLPALEAMASKFGEQSGIACEIDAVDEVASELLDAPAVAICLYRVAQEALNNVNKHSRASEVHIQLAKAGENSIALRVRDNGRGMEPADRRKSESFGILGMQERVRAHGGVMHIDGTPAQGTVLEVVIPLTGASLAFGSPSGSTAAIDRSSACSMYAALDDGRALPRLLSRATDQTLQDVIDAIAGIVAVVDRHGTIRFVNRAWTQFADCNGNPGAASIGPGANYLEVCRRSSLDDESALKVLRGLEEVLYEGRVAFACDYPCHSQEEQRWFRMHATAMANGDVMVAHFLFRVEERVVSS